jgi:myosin-5
MFCAASHASVTAAIRALRTGRREEPWALPASRPDTGEPAAAGATNSAAAGAVAVQTYVRPLAEELERKRALFMDDASFITEVREGRALAPGMDPEAELRTLRLRFDNFRRDFKVGAVPLAPSCPLVTVILNALEVLCRH